MTAATTWYYLTDGAARTERYEWLKAELARYTYKPNFTLELTPDLVGARLYGTFRAPDSRHTPTDAPDDWPTVAINFNAPVPPHLGTEPGRDSNLFAVWLRSVLFEVERHESDEWLCRDGVIINDPHAPTTTWTATTTNSAEAEDVSDSALKDMLRGAGQP